MAPLEDREALRRLVEAENKAREERERLGEALLGRIDEARAGREFLLEEHRGDEGEDE
jgi:vacuolar-type H+-ATPase subunit H